MKSYYDILEVSPDDSQEKIQEQYYFLVQAWHPDKYRNENDKQRANERIIEINEAYSVLRNPVKRAEYDSQFKHIIDSQIIDKPTIQDAVITKSQSSRDLVSAVITIANVALEKLIEDLIDLSVYSSYEKHLEKCILDSYSSLFPNRSDEYLTLQPKVVDEINFILNRNNHLRKFIERLELHNPIDKNYNWVQELHQTIINRRTELGLPHQDDFSSDSAKPFSRVKVQWKEIEPNQPKKSSWEKELEDMQERIRQRRKRDTSK